MQAHYRGTFLDGKKFDASYDRGQPLPFTVGRGMVIKCWDEGFVGLAKGAKADLICPPEYAYGERGAGGSIPPNTPLLFSIEVVEIVSSKKPKEEKKKKVEAAKTESQEALPFSVTVTERKSDGDTVAKGQKIKAHYHGTLLDGTKFDSSYDRKTPLEFTVGAG